MSKIQVYQHKRGIVKLGKKIDVFDEKLCDRIRIKLGLTKKQLSNKSIYKVTNIANKEIIKWVIENPEGYKLGKDMGVLAVSKIMPKEFRDDRGETIDKIKELDISELKRKQILKSYGVDVGSKMTYRGLTEFGNAVPSYSLSTFFYNFNLVWFNHRNCKTRKAIIYRLKPSRSIIREIYKKATSGKNYYELNFGDFYLAKIKTKL